MDEGRVFRYTVDLDKDLNKTILRDLFVTENQNAHTFRLKIVRRGTPVDLSSASVIGYFNRYKTRETVPLADGRIEGSEAVLTLSPACYAERTMFAVMINISIGDLDLTVFTGEGQMLANRYDKIDNSDGTIPTLDDLLAQINVMKEATADSRVAAQEARDAAETANQAAENIDEKVAEANAELAGKVGQLSEEIDAFREATLSCEIVNRFDKNAITEGYIAASGNFVSNSSWRCTDFIPCNAEILYFTCNDNGTRKPWGMSFVASYDAAKNLVSHVNTISDGVYTGTNENGFVRFAYKENDARTDYMLSADASYEYVEHKVDYKIKGSALPAEIARNGSNVLYGKKYTACGDSYTAGAFDGSPDTSYLDENGVLKTYHYFIGKRNAMEVLNHGVSGSIMALNKDYVAGTITNPNMDRPFAHRRYMEVPLDSDYITLAFGINDASRTNLGTIDDTTNETFYGAWNVVLDYFLQNAPFAKIGIIIYTPNRDYHDAILAIAKKWGKKVLDFSGEDSGLPWFMPERIGMPAEINAKYKELYRVSDTNRGHPSWQAHEYESTIIEDFLRSL